MTFRVVRTNQYNQDLGLIHSTNGNHLESPNEGSSIDHQVTIHLHAQNITMFPTNETWNHESSNCVTLNGSGIQLAVGPQPLWLRNHNFGLAQRIMVKRLATSRHDPIGITDSACKNQMVMVSVQYGPFNTYITIRSTTIDSIGYPRMRASGESSTTKHRLLHASGPHPIPPPNEPKIQQLRCLLKIQQTHFLVNFQQFTVHQQMHFIVKISAVATGFACDWFCLRLVTIACDWFCLRLVTVACDWFLLATDSFPLKYLTTDLYPSSSLLSPADRLTQRLVFLEQTTG
ncbi:hypothetical protein F511_28593 [Dorcoceras hygrometricum]|uniref:Uncharacterized protein n=1 Tax=Dorcoceras hygrometricum TaxID=472368 RepID=A0A2Z7AVM0_9LAMI|nr:hypothetical protein F511_28593 [Dorcoceras hygrometricum]